MPAPAVPLLQVDGLAGGYAGTPILHGIDLEVSVGQSLCLIGPNGSGKSTVLNAIFGLIDISAGRITFDGRDVTRLDPNVRLAQTGIAYVLQDDSVFPDMTVEQNLWLGGYLMDNLRAAKRATEHVFDRYPRLGARRREPARVLSGGERRLLEIARALMMEPRLLLVDEPSIGLEPRSIDAVFEALHELQHREGKAIVMAEQNLHKGLAYADRGCLLVAGRIAMAGSGRELLEHAELGHQFVGA
jgi:branched-chain amino acid transport system ATP-binding protein